MTLPHLVILVGAVLSVSPEQQIRLVGALFFGMGWGLVLVQAIT